jgi:hypothetical protein
LRSCARISKGTVNGAERKQRSGEEAREAAELDEQLTVNQAQ